MSLVKVTSPILDLQGKTKSVLLFSASWHEGCASVEAVLKALASTVAPEQLFVANIDAEELSELAESYHVTVVPTVIFLNGTVVMERLDEGVEPSQITLAFQRLVAAAAAPAAPADAPTTPTTVAPNTVLVDPEQALNDRLDTLIRSDTVMLFMKGVPTAPKCGFSRQAVELLQNHSVPFGSFDILSDEQVRQGLKKYSNWPTYPQIYVNGELQGGLDVLKELAEDGNLAQQFDVTPASPELSLHDRLSELVKRSDIMLFMKGLPSAPKCGFSRQMVAMLDEAGVPYDAFDILQDDEVRQGLKTFSNWPTFPQLYVKGDLVGGLDICKELQESGDLLDTLQP